jgi:hypothetical protein
VKILDEGPFVQDKATVADQDPHSNAYKLPVSVPRWIHERFPPLHELLCTHDVARLSRRLRWVIAGLCLIGRFTKKLKLHKRVIRRHRSEAVAWLAENLGITRSHGKAKRSGARRHRRKPGTRGKTSPGIRR